MSKCSPDEAPGLFEVGTKKTGRDDNIWVVIRTDSGAYHWKKIVKRLDQKRKRKRTTYADLAEMKVERSKTTCKLKTTRTFVTKGNLTDRNRTYYIHDNEGRPFKIVVNCRGIHVYTFPSYEAGRPNSQLHYTIFLRRFKRFMGYWTGYDSSPYAMHGNSLLIKISKYRYVFIGSEIYSFETNDVFMEDEIFDFVSPVGNSDVPYPVAYGYDNVYFMLDKQKVDRCILETPVTVKDAEDMYLEFYGHIGSKRGKHAKYDMKDVVLLENERYQAQ